MGNFLQQLLGTAPAKSEIPAVITGTSAQERAARQAGFPSYDAQLQWARQRNTPTGGTIPQGGGNPSGGPTIMGTQPMAMHPANILNYILGKWQGAMGGN